jgi:hypothetical protein
VNLPLAADAEAEVLVPAPNVNEGPPGAAALDPNVKELPSAEAVDPLAAGAPKVKPLLRLRPALMSENAEQVDQDKRGYDQKLSSSCLKIGVCDFKSIQADNLLREILSLPLLYTYHIGLFCFSGKALWFMALSARI